MKISALSSGSSGNCFCIEKENNAVLIDAGISAKQIVERMLLVGADPEKIKGIFITHEHSDHTKGADVFARKFNIPIFATQNTISNSFLCSNPELISRIKNNEEIILGKLKIEAFPKSHKAADPVSFNILGGKQVSVITDIGYACDNVIKSVESADFLCLESNHDEKMLDNGDYPYFLKQWIKSNTGHLSNKQCALCVLEHAKSSLGHLLLSHLSQNNNTPKIAVKTNKLFLKERKNFSPEVLCSERSAPTPMIKV